MSQYILTTIYSLYSSIIEKLILLGSMFLSLLICFLIFILLPLVFRFSYTIQRSILFLNFVKWPRNFNFNHPESVGLKGTRNFYVTTDENVKLGVWHILPKSLINEAQRKNSTDSVWYDTQLRSGKPVFLYMHGNSGTRAAPHRVGLYKKLQNLDYHVVAFDYRSYGDSSPVEPSESGTVADGKFMYEWVENRTQGSPLFVWGHSLGTGVSTHVLAILSDEGKQSYGLVLEAPFSNMRDAIRHHPLGRIFRFLPWFESCCVQSVYNNGIQFDTDVHINKVTSPIAILHAEDDVIVPYKLGRKLYETALKERNDSTIQFWSFKADLHLGHKGIFEHSSLSNITKNFVEESLKIHTRKREPQF